LNHDIADDAQPVVARLADFDPRSGSALERAFFNHRPLVILLCLLATLLLGWAALGLKLNASFEKTIPTQHPYIANYLANQGNLGGQGNALRIAVAVKQGDIFSKDYLETLQKLNDEVFLLPGVDRPFMKSLWTSNTRWIAVTEEGLDGNTVMGDSYDGSPAALAEVRANVERSGEIGQIVAADFQSSIIFVPLLDKDPLDYGELSRRIEALRAKYASQRIAIHVTGFAKVAGDLIDGLRQMLGFFALALAITTGVLYAYTRCVRSTLLVVACSLIAVAWQFGLLKLFGYELDPYSVLVPFLVFAIGMSHGAQKMNGILQDVGRGTHRVVAARYTFRRLFMAGLTALLCDAVGFAVLALIPIRVIQDLAAIASIGVAVLIFTNLVLLPVLLSYLGVSPAAAQRSLRMESREASRRGMWAAIGRFTERGPARAALAAGVVLAVAGYAISLQLRIGDLDPGAPELRADSRYNRDNAYIAAHYAASADILTVMVATPEDQCTRYAVLSQVDALVWRLQQLPGVESTQSMAALSKWASVGYNEGQLKWYELVPNDSALGGVQTRAPRELFNQGCSFLSLHVYLKDHKAETLARVVGEVERFIAEHDKSPGAKSQARFMLAAGSAGIDAATNIVVAQAMREMLLWVYGAVLVLCWLTFRSWRAVLVAVLPLVLTSILCEALMVLLGMGVKVATLPVIALGVGIGVDYALYVLSVMLARLRAGASLAEAFAQALQFTGRVVMLTGITLALAVGTWAFSPIKFQADMGVLLAFMFLWNMVGALVLLPALARWLLRPRAAARGPVADVRIADVPSADVPIADMRMADMPMVDVPVSPVPSPGVAASAALTAGPGSTACPAGAVQPGQALPLFPRTGASR
jgi:predicted RND superfamily exporter protein